MWRLKRFPLQKKSHAIIRLPIHLPDTQNILFNEKKINEFNIPQPNETMLTAFFKLNNVDNNACKYLYAEIGEH